MKKTFLAFSIFTNTMTDYYPSPQVRAMVLTGDDNTPSIPLTEAEVNHLRRLLAWMRCEWMLDPDMQRGYLLGASELVKYGDTTPERAGEIVTDAAERINKCPAYVRQAVKMLTKAIRDHDKRSGIHG